MSNITQRELSCIRHVHCLVAPGGVLELPSEKAEVPALLSPVSTADHRTAIQLHPLCGQLHPSHLLENRVQPSKHGRLPDPFAGIILTLLMNFVG